MTTEIEIQVGLKSGMADPEGGKDGEPGMTRVVSHSAK